MQRSAAAKTTLFAFVKILLLAAVAGLAADTLYGRAGGGGGYNSGGGGSGSGGDSGWLFEIAEMLIRLIIWKPQIGIPVTIVVVAIGYYIYRRGDSKWTHVKADWGNYEEPAATRPRFERGLTQLKGRDPAFDDAQFRARVRKTFIAIQNAWSSGTLANVRPLVTDGVQERFEILLEINERCQIKNVLTDVQVMDVQLRAVSSDKFFDTISVRIAASAADVYVQTGTDKIVHGARSAASFTEHWTFIRRPSVKTKAGAKGLADGCCPSCGAGLKIIDRGACAYCQAIVNSGSYDWVLCEITQAAAADAPKALVGVEALQARDPAFNAHYVEDRASVIFWRLRMAEVLGAPGVVQGIAAPEFLDAARGRWQKGADGGTTFFADAAVGGVDVVGVLPAGSGEGRDRLRVRVRWSGRQVTAKLPALVKPGFGQTRHFDQELVLARAADVKSPDKASFSTRACAACGAPETRRGAGRCERCGVTLNNGEVDWVLEDVRAFGGAAVMSGIGREPGIDDAIAAAAALIKADGKVRPAEYALLLEFALSRGLDQEGVDRIVKRVQERDEAAAIRFITKAQKRNFLYFMLKLCVADGEISAEEEAFMLRLGARLRVQDVDLPREIEKARKALQSSERNGRLVS